MVELCELQRVNKDVDYWPADIDQHVAQLEFDTSSSMMIEQSLYASSTTGGVDVTDPDEDDEEEEEEEMDQDEEDQRFRMEELAAVAAAAGLDVGGSTTISTDSLDMDLIRDCSGGGGSKNRRNDYKLIFEDSGQWTTTSGIGTSLTTNGAQAADSSPPVRRSVRRLQLRPVVSDSKTLTRPQELKYEVESNCLANGRMLDRHFGLRLLEQLNNDEWAEAMGNASDEEKQQLIGQLLSNITSSDEGTSADDLLGSKPMTTWGRIRSTQPFDAKTYSMQFVDTAAVEASRRSFSCADMPHYVGAKPPPNSALNRSGGSDASAHSKTSRTSLLANFVEQQERRNQSDNNDYEYNETYVGNGRYVDVNENEIGYVPESTAPIQSSTNSQAPQLTHFDLPPSFTAPDLKFLSLTHKAPSFCRSQISLDEMLRRARNGSLLLSENLFSDEKVAMLADAVCPITTQEQMGLFERHNAQPDSGLGSSSTSGPSHIEDWASLAVLLPKHVVDACSFFKTNSSLLTGSGSNASGSLNNIERKSSNGNTATGGATDFDTSACRTCFNVRRRRLHPPLWAHKAPAPAPKTALCDCVACCCCCATSAGVAPQTVSEIVTPTMCCDRSASRHRLSHSASTASASALTARIPKLNAAELSVVGLPIYGAKRALIERVVEGVAEIARGASAIVLYSALTRLLADGLLEDYRPWTVIVAITGNGPATSAIFNLVRRLEASEKSENSRIDHFFKELLNSNSLEGWLSYVVLKENVLTRMYADTAFLLRANSAYRSLFWRLIESVELLSVLSQCSRHRAQRRRDATLSSSSYVADEWQGASRLPSDSRIPKSSSIPEKLTPNIYSNQVVKNKTNNYSASKPPIDAFTLSRGKSASSEQNQRRASRIPVASSSAAHSMTQYGALLYSPASTLRTRSLHARTATPTTRTATSTITARVRERVTERDFHEGGRLLPLEKGEMVRVLSTRGDMSRCCRLHIRFGALLNGVVPTQKLDFC